MVSYRTIAFAVAFAAALAVLFMNWGVEENPAALAAIGKLNGEWVGRPAPQFELPDSAGQMHRLSEYRGKVVFLNFWASFCAPCREEMPSMESLVRQYKNQGLVMVAISHDAEKADMDGFMQTFLPGEHSSMTVLWDPKSETAKRYGTEFIPETYIIDQDGRIVARFVNAYDWTRPEVKQLIESLIRGESQRAL